MPVTTSLHSGSDGTAKQKDPFSSVGVSSAESLVPPSFDNSARIFEQFSKWHAQLPFIVQISFRLNAVRRCKHQDIIKQDAAKAAMRFTARIERSSQIVRLPRSAEIIRDRRRFEKSRTRIAAIAKECPDAPRCTCTVKNRCIPARRGASPVVATFDVLDRANGIAAEVLGSEG